MRSYSEFEHQSGVVLAFPYVGSYWEKLGLLPEVIQFYNELIDIISRYTKCVVIYNDYSYIDIFLTIKNDNIVLVKDNYDDIWCRDTLPFSLKDKTNTLLQNYQFNGWGNKYEFIQDNALSKNISNIFKSKIENVDFILEGGSIDFNSKRIAITTTSCLLNENRNDLSREDIDELLRLNFNLNDILWIENGSIDGDDTDGHIDMLARFVSDDTIVYSSCDDINDENFEALKNMRDELHDKYSDKYTLIPINIPYKRYFNGMRLPFSYINFLAINGAIILPTYNNTPSDSNAIKIFKKLFTKRDIVTLDATILTHGGGSIHCATRNFFGDTL